MLNESPIHISASDEVQLLTAPDVAKRLRISVRGVWRQVSVGEIPKPIYLGRLARWPLPVIKQWMEDGCPSCDDS